MPQGFRERDESHIAACADGGFASHLQLRVGARPSGGSEHSPSMSELLREVEDLATLVDDGLRVGSATFSRGLGVDHVAGAKTSTCGTLTVVLQAHCDRMSSAAGRFEQFTMLYEEQRVGHAQELRRYDGEREPVPA